MPDRRRILRLEQALLETVAPLVAHGLADPRLGLVTVTRIRLSPDMSVARVNWSCLGGAADRNKAAHALEHARGRLQAAVAKSLRTRKTPHLEFHFDDSLEQAERINRIFVEIEKERPPTDAPEDPEAEEE